MNKRPILFNIPCDIEACVRQRGKHLTTVVFVKRGVREKEKLIATTTGKW